MDEKKIDCILKSTQGITYMEWKKLKHVIDVHFNSEATIQENNILMARPEVIIDSYKRLF